jgi:hypothetical protein
MLAVQDVILEADLPARVGDFSAKIEFIVVFLPFNGTFREELLKETKVTTAAAFPRFDVHAVFADYCVDKGVGEDAIHV